MQEKVAELINIVFGFRKFILMLLLFSIGVVFRLKNYIDGSQFVDLMKNTAIAFFTANGFEHLTTMVREYVASNGKKIEETAIESGSNDSNGSMA